MLFWYLYAPLLPVVLTLSEVPQWAVVLAVSTISGLIGALLAHLVKRREIDATAQLGSAELQLKESGDMRREYALRLTAVETKAVEREKEMRDRITVIESALATLQGENIKLRMEVGTARLAIARSEGERRIIRDVLKEGKYGLDDLHDRIANGSVTVDKNFLASLTVVRAHVRHLLVDVLDDVEPSSSSEGNGGSAA